MWCERIFDLIKKNSTVPGAVVVFAMTYLLMLAVNAGEAGAAWVQAIGSIAALMGAAYLPIYHFQHSETRQEVITLSQLRFLAEETYEQVWALTNCFIDQRIETRKMRVYLGFGKSSGWTALEVSSNQYPIERIPAAHLNMLAAIQQAVTQAQAVCRLLPDWVSQGSHPELVAHLRYRRDVLGRLINAMPRPEGLPERPVLECSQQVHGAWAESQSPRTEQGAFRGGQIYWTFYGHADCPTSAVLILVHESGAVLRETLLAENYSDWVDTESAIRVLYRMAECMAAEVPKR